MKRQPVQEQVAARLLGRTRSAILGLLFYRPDQDFYQQEITQAVGARLSAVQRELRNLQASGLVRSVRRGNRRYYRANSNAPLFPELHSLVLKTTGLANVVGTWLAPVADRVEVAFVFGSVAAGTPRADSDIDVCLIGEVTLAEVAPLLREARRVLGREVNPVTYRAEEWRRCVARGDHFVQTVLGEPRVFLIGDEHGLGRLGTPEQIAQP